MSCSYLFLAFAFISSVAGAEPEVPTSQRGSKQLGLFTIVNFKNEECTAVGTSTYSGLKGTCFSGTECDEKGGTKSGNCASGFGSCCIFLTTATTATITHNNTIIQNSQYPAAKTAGAGSFVFTISPSNHQDICAIRFDFIKVVIYGGTDNYVTTELSTSTDRLQIDGPTAVDPPLLGNTLTGQHVYVETARSATATTLTITTLASTANHLWRIQVKHIDCASSMLPPNGCQQYFTTDTGTVMTHGYNSAHTSAGGQELALQHTTMCIRQNKGYCSVAYTAKTSTTLTSAVTSFIVGAITIAANGNVSCTIAAVKIPGLMSSLTSLHQTAASGSAETCGASNFCGGTLHLCTGALQIRTGDVVQKPPFIINYITGSAPADTTFGFGLQYGQLGCDKQLV